MEDSFPIVLSSFMRSSSIETQEGVEIVSAKLDLVVYI